jgi:hypothetical protein
MIRTLNAVMLVTSLVGLVGVYALKYAGEDTAKAKVTLEGRIERQRADLSVLKADWAYLNQPAYIAPIVQRHQADLDLQVTKQEQFGSMDGLPMRPAPDKQALDALFESLDSGVDPIEKIIEAN